MKLKTILKILIFALISVSFHVIGQERVNRERVYIKDIAGIWINKKYINVLQKIKMPHLAAKRIPPMVIAIRKDGRSYPIVITDFEGAVVKAILDVQPGEKRGLFRIMLGEEDRPTSSDDVEYIWMRGSSNLEGVFTELEIAEIYFNQGEWDSYKNVGPALGPFINRSVIAGRYKNEKGEIWEFAPEGQAYFPDRTFYYEMSIRDSLSNCEYIEGEDLNSDDGIRRIGFSWRDEKLELFKARIESKKVICDPKPFVTLDPIAG